MDADVLGAAQGRPRITNSGCYLAEESMGEKLGSLVGTILGLFEERFVAERSEMRRHGEVLYGNSRNGNHDTAWQSMVRQRPRLDNDPMLGIVESAECQGQHRRIIEQAHHEIRGETIDQRLSGFGQLPQVVGEDVAHNWLYLPANRRSACSLELTRAIFSDVLMAETVLPKASR